MKQVIVILNHQVLLVGLVIVDTLLVITELMLDLALKDPESPLPFVFHALSLSVMSIFMVEIALKIYAYQLEFFTHKVKTLYMYCIMK